MKKKTKVIMLPVFLLITFAFMFGDATKSPIPELAYCILQIIVCIVAMGVGISILLDQKKSK